MSWSVTACTSESSAGVECRSDRVPIAVTVESPARSDETDGVATDADVESTAAAAEAGGATFDATVPSIRVVPVTPTAAVPPADRETSELAGISTSIGRLGRHGRHRRRERR